MVAPQLPAGVTTEMLANIATFFAQQNAVQVARPSGILQPNQIRGVNPRYKYNYQEYPKALQPPDVQVENEMQERSLRHAWGMPLPWPDRELDGGPSRVEAYYALRAYPVVMSPPQVIVHTAEEEEAKLASWNVESSEDGGSRVRYPRYMFHIEKGGKLISSRTEEDALGKGWYSTPREAMTEAMEIAREIDRRNTGISKQEADESREEIMTRAESLGIKTSPSWGVKRLKDEIDKASKIAA